MSISIVRDVRGNNEKHDAFYTMAPLNKVLSLFGFNCIYRDGTALKYIWSWPKIIMLILLFGALNVFNLYNKLFIWKGVISFRFRDAVQVVSVFGFFQYLVDVCYVFKRGRKQYLLYLSIYEHIDSILSLTSYDKIRRSITNMIIFFCTISVISSGVDIVAWFISFGMPVIVAYCIDYFYVILRNLSLADLISQLIQVSYRLEAVGDTLKEFYVLNDTEQDVKDVVAEKNGLRTVSKKSRSVHPESIKTIDQYDHVIQKLCGCYLLILEQCDYINSMYGVRILGMCLSNLIDMTFLLNLILRIMLGSFETTYYSGIFPALSSLLRVLALALVLFYKAHRCEMNYNQINRIIRYIDYLLINKKIDITTRETLQTFRSLVTSRPVQFHAINFYKLDCALLLSMPSTVVTYTIILLQNMK